MGMENPCTQCKTHYKDCSHDCIKYDEWVEFRDAKRARQCNKHRAAAPCAFIKNLTITEGFLRHDIEITCKNEPCESSR